MLYVEFDKVNQHRSEFFKGERSRFNHYYKLDKRTPSFKFSEELAAVLDLCTTDLKWRLSASSLERLRNEISELEQQKKADIPQAMKAMIQSSIIRKIEDALGKFSMPDVKRVEPRTVFLSYRFEEQEFAEGISKLLTDRGLTVVTGARAQSSISAAILERIKNSECFLSLMTRHQLKEDGQYTTSPWLLEEKGAAIALGKPIVIMVEEGVDEIGGLQGDWQRIHFSPKGFLKAALQAVEQAASYTGIGAPNAGQT